MIPDWRKRNGIPSGSPVRTQIHFPKQKTKNQKKKEKEKKKENIYF